MDPVACVSEAPQIDLYRHVQFVHISAQRVDHGHGLAIHQQQHQSGLPSLSTVPADI